MLVKVEVKKIVPIELLDVSNMVTELKYLDKVVDIELHTLNILADFACKAHLRSNDTFKQMKELVPTLNAVLKQTRLAIFTDSCHNSDIPSEHLENDPVFYRLDLKRGL